MDLLNSILIDGLLQLVTIRGDLKSRIHSATGFEYNEFKNILNRRDEKRSIDLTWDTHCDKYSCRHCFFQESYGEKWTTLSRLNVDNFNNVTVSLYPREALTDTNWVQYALALKQPYIATNGLRLASNPFLIRKLTQAGITHAILSLHGDPAAHANLTGSDESIFPVIKKAIKTLINHGIQVTIATSLYKGNIQCLYFIADLLVLLGVRHWEITRVLPLGKATKWNEDDFLTGRQLLIALCKIGTLFRHYPKDVLRISIDPSFGPNFYRPGIFRYLCGHGTSSWAKWKYVCSIPTLEYLCLSLDSGAVYPCFMLRGCPDASLTILKDTSNVISQCARIPKNWDSFGFISRLRGQCSSYKCQYSNLCLGGCRAVAYAWAHRAGKKDPLFDEMDMCVTREIERVLLKG